MICPICANQVGLEEANCPSCQTGLTEYAQAHAYPDLLFNAALTQLRRGQHAPARALLCTVCQYRPDDQAALRLWAHAASLCGDPAEAVRVLLDALELGEDPDLQRQYDEALAAYESAESSLDTLLRKLADRMDASVSRLEATALREPDPPPAQP